MMKAIQFDHFGGPNVLTLQDLDTPDIKEGELLIKVGAAGINPIDCKIREGDSFVARTLHLPSKLGYDMCGQVVAGHAEFEYFKEGDIVFGLVGLYDAPQTYAEYCVAKPVEIILKPDGLSAYEAAALPLVGLTAWQAIHEHGQCKAGERVLIHAAAGGVGHLASQFAKETGAYVIGTATEKDHAYLTSLGVDECIDYSFELFEKKARDMDLIIDLVGGETGKRSLSCLAPEGRLITVPTFSHREVLKAAEEAGVNAKGMLMHLSPKDLIEIGDKVASKAVKINLADVFPLEDAALAHTTLEEEHASGKYVLSMPKG